MASAPPPPGHEALRALLMGPGSGQMNLAQVRARAEELKRSLDHVIHALQFAPDRVQWADAVERFAVINVQYQHLTDTLRPLLRHYVAHPRSVNQSNAGVLPLMLATRLLPEQDALHAELLAEHAAAAEAGGGGSSDGGGGLPQLPALLAETEAGNALIDALTLHSGAGTGPLDPKGPLRRGLAAALARAAPAAGAGGPARQQQQQVPPGAGELQGPDLLVAAAVYGTGLG